MGFGISRKTLTTKDLFVFIIGLLSMIKMRFLGTFAVSEILIFASYFFISKPFAFRKDKNIVRLMVLSFVWLLGVVVADLYNNTDTEDFLKGFFNVVFIIALIPFVYWAVYDKPQRMMMYWLGVGISCVLGFYFQRMSELTEYDASVWLVYAYYPLFIAIAGWLYYKGRRILGCIVIEAFSVWSLWNMSRNIFLCMTFAVALILLIGEVNKTNVAAKYRAFRKRMPITLLSFVIVGLGIFTSYEYLAKNKYLGEYAYRKYIIQKNSEQGLASGRADFFESVALVYKNPIMGYGSYAKDQKKIINPYATDEGATIKVGERMMLHGHSYLMGAWVYSGILGFIFWAVMIIYTLRFLYRGVFFEPSLIGINVMLAFLMLWNMLFSPFADRLNFLFFIIIVILQTYRVQAYAGKKY